MKIYTQSNGYRGGIVVIANSEAEARELMAQALNYSAENPVEEHPIEHGFIFYNYGDI